MAAFVLVLLIALPMIFITVLGILLVGMLAVCSTQVIGVLSLLTRSGPWGFGENWLLLWIVSVEARRLPLRQSVLITTEEAQLRALAFHHTALPHQPRVLENIWDWLRIVLTEHTRKSTSG